MKARWPKFGSGEIIILIVIGIMALIVVTGNARIIWEKLYSGYSVAIVVIMLIEYLLLKGSDRTAIYRRELEAARVKRRDDLLALRDLEARVVELRGRLANTLEREEEAGAAGLLEAVENARQSCELMLTKIRGRI